MYVYGSDAFRYSITIVIHRCCSRVCCCVVFSAIDFCLWTSTEQVITFLTMPNVMNMTPLYWQPHRSVLETALWHNFKAILTSYRCVIFLSHIHSLKHNLHWGPLASVYQSWKVKWSKVAMPQTIMRTSIEAMEQWFFLKPGLFLRFVTANAD